MEKLIHTFKMGIIASNPCLFMFSIGTLIGARGTHYALTRSVASATAAAKPNTNTTEVI